MRIDFEKLQQHDNFIVDRDGKHTYLLEDGSSFRWLKIEDYNMFGVMCAGTKKNKCMKQDYSRMDIVVGDKLQGNLQNRTVEEYKDKIKRVFQYLSEEYGISVDLQYLKFSEMEINCTFELEEEFYKYHRVLRLMMVNLPKSFKKMGQVSGVNKKEQCLESETFYRGNASMETKIYDKKKQLKQTIQFVADKNIMRIEFILKKSQKIKEVFKSTLVSDLTDEKINEFYYKQFERLFERPYRKWQIENEKQLNRMIIYHKRKNRKYWKSNLLRECSNKEQKDQIPLLLDIKNLLAQVKVLDKDGHYKRVEKGILKQCSYSDVYLQHDSDKAEEIITKVHEAYDNYLNGVGLISVSYSTINGEVA